MYFDEKNRKLTSSTGYLHAKDDSLYVDHEIFLGSHDKPDNYEEITKEEYEAYVKKQEEEEKNAEEGREQGR